MTVTLKIEITAGESKVEAILSNAKASEVLQLLGEMELVKAAIAKQEIENRNNHKSHSLCEERW